MTKKNFLIGTAVIGGIGLAGWMGYKTFKKELKKEEEESSKEEQQIEEKMEEVEVEENDHIEPSDFVADLALRSHNRLGDDDAYDIRQGLANGAHTIHVRKMKRSLDFLLQVPIGMTGVPNMGEFTVALKEATETTWSKYVKFTEAPFGQFEAWMIINFTDNNGVRQSGMVRVPKEIVNSYQKVTEDGRTIKEKKSFVEVRCVERLNKTGIEITETDGQKDPKFVRAILLWRISYFIENGRDAGISLESATDCLDYLLDKFSVGSREAAEFFYENIVFYSSQWPNIRVWSFEAGEKNYHMIDSPVVYNEK